MKVLTSEEMRQAEAFAAEHGTSLTVLMRNAAEATADAARRLLGSDRRRIVIAAGPGNNGGDGLVTAALLADLGYRTIAGVVRRKDNPDPPYLQAAQAGVQLVDLEGPAGMDEFTDAVRGAGLVIDALFGTGKIRKIAGAAAGALKALSLRPAGAPLLSVDLPSGLNADTGEVDELTPNANLTVTFGCPKLGLYLFPGAGHAGDVEVAGIGIPAAAFEASDIALIDEQSAAALLPERPRGGHKGTFGKVLVVAGSSRYVGAAYLACAAAGRSGSGIVTLATGESTYRLLAGKLVEPTFLPLPENGAGQLDKRSAAAVLSELDRYDSLVIGPGLGRSEASDIAILGILRNTTVPTVVDADALNVLSTLQEWESSLPEKCVLTPHSGELSRLIGVDITAIEGDRIGTARSVAGKAGRTVILKGAHTLVADPCGGMAIQPNANPALSTGGTGDVLAGIIGGLLAQGLQTGDAARLGVYLHAAAAREWSKENGSAGLLASDLLVQIPRAIHSLRA